MNTLYDTAQGSLAQEGKLVRIRIERPAPLRGRGKKSAGSAAGAAKQRAVLTYKGPAPEGDDARGANGAHGPRYKIREEHEVRVEDAGELERIFQGMGLSPCFRYEKYRSTYRLPGLAGLTVELDETPIGDFLELEGDSAAIDRAAALLGFGPADYITKSYGILFLEQRRSAAGADGEASPGVSLPGDMLFPSPA
jgi:adenylate cyclase class 2